MKITSQEAKIVLKAPEALQYDLAKLGLATGKSEFTDVIRRAIATYKLIVDHQADGGEVIFRSADGREEEFPNEFIANKES